MSADNYLYVRKVSITRADGPVDCWTFTMESASADEPSPLRPGHYDLYSTRELAYDAAEQFQRKLESEGGYVEYGISCDPKVDVAPQKAADRAEVSEAVQAIVEQEQGKLWQEFWAKHDEDHPVAMEDCFACSWDIEEYEHRNDPNDPIDDFFESVIQDSE